MKAGNSMKTIGQTKMAGAAGRVSCGVMEYLSKPGSIFPT
jgi:hypothetical protein